MPLYLLKQRDGNILPTNIGRHGHYSAFVIRAGDETTARRIATAHTERADRVNKDWENPKIASCERIAPLGLPGVILGSYYEE